MQSGGSTSSSSVDVKDINSLEDFRKLLVDYKTLHQDFLALVTDYRYQTAPGWVESTFGVRLLSSSAKPTNSTPLLALKNSKDKQTDKQSLSRLNAFLEASGREKTLSYGVIGCDKLLKVFENDGQTAQQANDHLAEEKAKIKANFIADKRASESIIVTERKKAYDIFNKLQQYIITAEKLTKVEEKIPTLLADTEKGVAEFNEKVKAFYEKYHNDGSVLAEIATHVPSADVVAGIPQAKIEYLSLIDRVIANNLGKDWRDSWGKGDTFQEQMKLLQAKHSNVWATFGDRLAMLEKLNATCESVTWIDVLSEAKNLIQEINANQAPHNMEAYRQALINIIDPLLSKKSNLSGIEKERLYKAIEAAFGKMKTAITQQNDYLSNAIRRIDKLMGKIPVLERFVESAELKNAADEMQNLYHKYDRRFNTLTHLEGYARFYSDEHVVIMLEQFRHVVTKEDYQKLCERIGASDDLSLVALFKKHMHRLPASLHVLVDEDLLSDRWQRANTLGKLENWRNFGDLLFVETVCAEGGGSKAREILTAGSDFLKNICRQFSEENKKNKATYKAASTLGHDKIIPLVNLEELFNNSRGAINQLAEYDSEKTAESMASAQAEITSATARLKNKWDTQSDCYEMLNARFKGNLGKVERLAALNGEMKAMQVFFGKFNSESFPVLREDGSNAYNKIVTKLNELIWKAQKIHLIVDQFLENDLYLLKEWVDATEKQIKAEADVQINLFKADIAKECAGMNAEIEEAAQWNAPLGVAQRQLSRAPSLISTLKKQDECYIQFLNDDNQIVRKFYGYARGLNDTANPMRHWFENPVQKFLADLEIFFNEEEVRKRLVAQAKEWSKAFEPNLNKLTTLNTLWNRIKEETEKAKKNEREHNSNLVSLSALDKRKSTCNERIALNTQLLKQLENLQQGVLFDLQERLDVKNSQSRAMIRCSINNKFRSDGNVWRQMTRLASDQFIQQKNRIDLTRRNIKNLKKLHDKFVSIPSVGTEEAYVVNGNIYYIKRGNNYEADAKIALDDFLNLVDAAQSKAKSVTHLDELIVSKKTFFLEVCRQFLAQIEQAKSPVMIAESAVQANYNVNIAKLFKEGIEESERLEQSIMAIKADIAPSLSSTALVRSNVNVTKSDHVLKYLPAIEKRKKLSKLDDLSELLASSHDQAVLNKVLAASLKAIIKDESKADLIPAPTAILNVSTALLAKHQQEINLKISELALVSAKKTNNLNEIEMLKAEKERLVHAQKAALSILNDAAAKLLSDDTCKMLRLSVAGDQVKFVAAIAGKLDEITEKVKSIKFANEALEKSKKDMKSKYQDYASQVEKLTGFRTKFYKLLNDKTLKVQDLWHQELKELGQAVNNVELHGGITSALKVFVNDVIPNVDGLVSENISEPQKLFSLNEINNYNRYCLVAENILAQINVMWRVDGELRRGLYESMNENAENLWLAAEPEMWIFYHAQMKKLMDHYEWSVKANDFNLSAEALAVKDKIYSSQIVGLTTWLSTHVEPFREELKLFNACTEQLNRLNVALEALEDEKKIIDEAAETTLALKAKSEALQVQEKAINDAQGSLSEKENQANTFKAKKQTFANAKSAIIKLDKFNYAHVDGVIFKRIKYLFFLDPEVIKVINELREKAAKHDKDGNKNAIKWFVDQLSNCDSSLSNFIGLIANPLLDDELGEDGKKVSLTRTRGGPTKTCELLRKLESKISMIIKTCQSNLILNDIEEELAQQEKQLCADGVFDLFSPGIIQLNPYIFEYCYQKISDDLLKLKSLSATALATLQTKLQDVEKMLGNELVKLVTLKDLIEKEYQVVLKSTKFLTMHSKSELGDLLKSQLDNLEQIVATYEEPAKRLTLSSSH